MPVPDDRRYLKTHEWHMPTDGLITIGITRFAADQLTDITFVDLPEPGRVVQAGQPFGVVESVKATSDLYTGVSGEIVATNGDLAGAPELVNNDPFGAGWLIRVRPSNPAEYDALLSADEYRRMIGEA